MDTVLDQEQLVNYLIEFLNSLNLEPFGMPPNRSILKLGCATIPLSNLKKSNNHYLNIIS